MTRRIALLIIALLAACSAPHMRESIGVAALAATAGPLVSVADAQIRYDQPSNNKGTTATMIVGTASGVTRRGLIRFDLSSVPAGTITSATLTLYVTAAGGAIGVHDAGPANNGAPFGETSITWATMGPGGATEIASFAGTVGSHAIPLDPALVSTWRNPAASYGVMLNGSGANVTIATREDSAHAPTLTIYYDAPPTCSDGVQNQGETGVDCGGPCPACPTPDAGAGGSDAGADAGIDAGPGGNAIAPLTDCGPWIPDNAITHTTYSYGSDPANVLDLWLPLGSAPSGGWPVVVNVHGGGFVGGQSLAACPGGDPYSLGCIGCGAPPGGVNPCNPIVPPNVLTTLQGNQALALQYYARVLANGPAHLMPDGSPMHSVAVVNLRYRLMAGNYPSAYNAYPAAVNDAQTAQAWLVANAASLGINPGRIGWIGYSAGGHLAAKVTGIARRALWYSNLYFDTPAEWGSYNPGGYNYVGCAAGDLACVATKAPAVDAAPAVGDCPVLLSHSMTDNLVLPIQSQRYYAAAQALGVPATLMTFTDPNGAPWHGYQATVGGYAKPSNCTVQAFWQGL